MQPHARFLCLGFSVQCSGILGFSVQYSENTGVGCHLLLQSSDLPVPSRGRYPIAGSALGSLLTEQVFSTVDWPWGEAACAVTRTPSPHLIAYCICVISASQWRGPKQRLPDIYWVILYLAVQCLFCNDVFGWHECGMHRFRYFVCSHLFPIPPFTQHPNCAPSSSLTIQSTHLPFSRRPWRFLSQETSLSTGRWIVEWLAMAMRNLL